MSTPPRYSYQVKRSRDGCRKTVMLDTCVGIFLVVGNWKDNNFAYAANHLGKEKWQGIY